MKVAFAAAFALQADVFDGDVVAERLAHIVDGERGDAGGGQCFHFHAGFVGDAAGGADVERAGGVIVGKIERDFVQRQWVAERNQVGGLLGGHDARDLRGRGNGTLARLAAACTQRGIDVRRETDAGCGRGFAAGGGFVADIDHMRVAVVVKMGEGHRFVPGFASLRGC